MIKYGYKHIRDLFGHAVRLDEIYESPICRYDSDPSATAALTAAPAPAPSPTALAGHDHTVAEIKEDKEVKGHHGHHDSKRGGKEEGSTSTPAAAVSAPAKGGKAKAETKQPLSSPAPSSAPKAEGKKGGKGK